MLVDSFALIMEPIPSALDTLNQELQIANLSLISYSKLMQKDSAEVAKLYLACAHWGFFYLDLDGNETKDYLEIVAALFAASKKYFAKPLEEKLKDTSKHLDVYNICG